MTDDRRHSVRRSARLPFAWCEVAPGATVEDVCIALGLPRGAALRARLAAFDEDLERAAAALTDPALAEALRALDGKLTVLEEAVLAEVAPPPESHLELSADGVGFEADAALELGTCLGVHLVLPAAYPVVCKARVSHCEPAAASSYRIGAEFRELDPAVARRLTRFTIARSTGSDKP